MLINKCFCALVLTLGLVMPAVASNVAVPANNAVTATDTRINPSETLTNFNFKEDFCPQPQTLKKGEDLWWSAPNDWKSDSESFVYEIGSFLGARWTGINVGKVVCLYGAKEKQTFPIALVRETLVPTPEFKHKVTAWGPNEGGYKDCQASDVTECPFLIEQPKKPKDIYQDLDFFKGKEDAE